MHKNETFIKKKNPLFSFSLFSSSSFPPSYFRIFPCSHYRLSMHSYHFLYKFVVVDGVWLLLLFSSFCFVSHFALSSLLKIPITLFLPNFTLLFYFLNSFCTCNECIFHTPNTQPIKLKPGRHSYHFS